MNKKHQRQFDVLQKKADEFKRHGLFRLAYGSAVFIVIDAKAVKDYRYGVYLKLQFYDVNSKLIRDWSQSSIEEICRNCVLL